MPGTALYTGDRKMHNLPEDTEMETRNSHTLWKGLDQGERHVGGSHWR